VGAALEVYLPAAPERGLPLALLANKPFVGHSEPAAGISGVVYAAHQLAHSLAAPQLHLRSLNPYVGSVLASKGLQAAAGQLVLPRGGMPLAASSRGQGMAVSAFAFQVGWRSDCISRVYYFICPWTGHALGAACCCAKRTGNQLLGGCPPPPPPNSQHAPRKLQGTNAHAIMSAAPVYSATPSQPALAWRRQRVWPHPRHSSLLTRSVSAGPAAAVVEAALCAHRMAVLWDHRVRLLARALLLLALALCRTQWHDCARLHA